MNRKFLRTLLLFTFLLSVLLLTAEAEEPAFDGYLVKLKGEVALQGELASLEPIINQVYWVEDLSLIEEHVEYGDLEYIEPNYYVSLFGSGSANPDGWAYSAMKGEVAGESGLNGTGIRIGVIDSGLNRTADLEDTLIATGYNFLLDNTDTTDNYGHGTIVSSMIAADHDGSGISGIAPNATIVPLKCFNGGQDGTIALLATAIRKAADSAASGGFECDILQMSWGITRADSTLYSAIEYATMRGCVLVAAAGNSGTATKFYPASYPEVISVAAVDPDLEKAPYSQYNDQVTLTAPGTSVTSPYISLTNINGTSFSSPCVSGAIALLLQRDPTLNPAQITNLLTTHAMDLGASGYDPTFGHGFVRLDWLLGGSVPPVRLQWSEATNRWQAAYLVGSDLYLSGGLQALEPTTVMASLYTSSGKLLRSRTEVLPASAKTYHFSLGSIEGVGLIRLFILKSNLAPYSAKIQWALH